ncbi:hypothetical protein LTR37_010538 [Vermiconidia calcicola]|uniref:Uncharacterized protein n=1 Tax=Vermiconidia calcicola TaxID=1690605 RepID=A0ACC3N4V2_9PEZI|nr:hypothetical protein LTR37_010538 [Vermiconidia calcicola]
MEEQVDRLVKKAWARYQDTPRSKRLMIAVSGIPGSGRDVAELLREEISHADGDYRKDDVGCEGIATFLPMDGYHLTREQLSAMPDPHTAHFRRGAAFTFDAPAFLELVKKLREPLCAETATIYAPSFDHAVKDPVADDIPIAATSRVVVMEGNYLSLGSGAPEWKEAAELMDELWFVEVDEDVARQRLTKRHVASGIVANEDEGRRRADETDLVNGREIVEGRLKVDEVIHSREDDGWKPEQQGIDKERDGKKEA